MHGLIHQIGFFAAFSKKVQSRLGFRFSKPIGGLWLTTSILFLIATIAILTQSNISNYFVLFVILLSQGLIFFAWRQTRFGTLINMLILLLILPNIFYQYSSTQIQEEVKSLLTTPKPIVASGDSTHLPLPIQKFIKRSLGKESTPSPLIYLRQKLQMKLDTAQTEWYTAQAQQFFNTETASFHWSVNMHMLPGVSVMGTDVLHTSNAQLKMKLFGLIPVANVKNNRKVNIAAQQRYLAEMIWFPHAFKQTSLNWVQPSKNEIKASFKSDSLINGTFYFNNDGTFKAFKTMRYKDANKDAILYPWIIECIETGSVNHIQIPKKLQVSWVLNGKKWTWLKVEVTHIKYNATMGEFSHWNYYNLGK